MFVRAKTVKGNKYAYLVKNKWKKGKVKQETKKYLGKIIVIPNSIFDFEPSPIDFSKQKTVCFRDVVANELCSRGFVRKRNKLILGDVVVDLVSGKILEKERPVVLLLNGRYLFKNTLSDLLDFFRPEAEEERKGERLAKAFSDAGVGIQKEDFIQLYKKIYL